MNRTILYYPTIDIPNDKWLRHALMYWDEVSSIVPMSWENNMLMNLSPEIHYLMDEGQFRPVKPEDLFMKGNWELVKSFNKEFIGKIKTPHFQQLSGTDKNRLKSRIHKNKLDLSSRIHSNKITYGVFDFLEEKGLARKGDYYDEWFYFEEKTAFLYMSLLAKYLAEIDPEHVTIGTDNSIYERYNFRSVNGIKGGPVLSFYLNKILPTPIEDVPFEKIIEFKRKRNDNLIEFRKIISGFESKLSGAGSASELKSIVVGFEEELTKGTNDLAATLNDSKIKYALKGLNSLINIKSPTSWTAVGSMINQGMNLINISLPLNILGVVAVAGIQLSINYVEKGNENRERLRKGSFSYIYDAQRRGILRNFATISRNRP